MSAMPLILTVLPVLVGAAALVSAVATRISGQCRHRVAHARVIAHARRIEETRRRQVIQRLSQSDAQTLPGLRGGRVDCS